MRVDDPVHEVPVVRRHEERAGKRLEEGFEPDDRFDVEVVRRLVEEEHVGTAEKHARHGDAHLPAAGERPDVAVDPLIVEPEAVQHFARLALERVAAEMLVLLLDLAEARQDLVHVVGARRIGHRLIQRFELVMEGADAPAAGDGLVEHAAARHLFDVLAEVADRHPLGDRHVALVGGFLAGDHPEQSGLARAVRADEPDLLTRVELKGGVDEEHLAAVLLADSGERNHLPLWYPGRAHGDG